MGGGPRTTSDASSLCCPSLTWVLRAALLLGTEVAIAQEACGWYCKDWCAEGVVACHRLVCNPDSEKDCPGTTCVHECGTDVVHVPPDEPPGKGQTFWVPLVSAVCGLACCLGMCAWRCCKSWRRSAG